MLASLPWAPSVACSAPVTPTDPTNPTAPIAPRAPIAHVPVSHAGTDSPTGQILQKCGGDRHSSCKAPTANIDADGFVTVLAEFGPHATAAELPNPDEVSVMRDSCVAH